MDRCPTITKVDQLKIILRDGEWHPRRDLLHQIETKAPALKVYVTTLRKQLLDNELIICELKNRVIGYRLVNKVNSRG